MGNKIGAAIATLLKLNETIHNLIYCLQEENCVILKAKMPAENKFFDHLGEGSEVNKRVYHIQPHRSPSFSSQKSLFHPHTSLTNGSQERLVIQ